MTARPGPPRLRHGLALASMVAATLMLAVPARAAFGTDSYGSAPLLLFSDPGTVASNQTYTKQGAGEPITTACSSPAMEHTAWWRFNGTGQSVTLTTAASDFDTVLAVYDAPTGIPIAGNRVDCNDDDPSPLAGTTSALT